MPVCLDCPPVIVAPTGTDGDDAPSVQAAAEANAYQSPVQLADGTFHFDSPCRLPSGTVLLGSAGTRIVSRIPANGDVMNATFLAMPVWTDVRTALVSANTPGTNTITTQDAVPAGSLIIVSGGGNGLRAQYYNVEAAAGDGPYTLVLDRPVLDQYAVADAVTITESRPQDIVVLGNGMTISGTAERYAEFEGAFRSVWDNVIAEPSSGTPADIMFSFDIGGRENIFSRMQVDGGGISFAGLALESNEDSIIDQSTASDTTNAGLMILDSFGTSVHDSIGRNSYVGLFLSTDAISGRSCTDTDVDGGSFTDNTSTGIEIFAGAQGTHIDGSTASGNLWYGVTLIPEGQVMSDTKLENVTATGNAHDGLVIMPGALNTKIRDVDVSNSGSMGVYAASGFDSAGLVSHGGNPVCGVYFAAGPLTSSISYGDIDALQAGSIGVYVAPQNTLNVDHSTIASDGPASKGLDLTGGVCTIERTTTLRGAVATLPPGWPGTSP